MKYTVIFELSPPYAFGLPEQGKIVIPGGEGSVNGPTLDTVTGKLVGHGTLSRYREDTDRLQVLLTLPSSTIRLNDNFAFVESEAPDSNQALDLKSNRISLFTRYFAS
jgi:hypothetical protein